MHAGFNAAEASIACQRSTDSHGRCTYPQRIFRVRRHRILNAKLPSMNNWRGVNRWCQWVQPRVRMGRVVLPRLGESDARKVALANPFNCQSAKYCLISKSSALASR
jgi:hypothetical protein